jgi:hypothetical protein
MCHIFVYYILLHARILRYAKHWHSFRYVCEQLPFQTKGKSSTLLSEEHGTLF